MCQRLYIYFPFSVIFQKFLKKLHLDDPKLKGARILSDDCATLPLEHQPAAVEGRGFEGADYPAEVYVVVTVIVLHTEPAFLFIIWTAGEVFWNF